VLAAGDLPPESHDKGPNLKNYLTGDAAALRLLGEKRPDYLLLMNSADIMGPQKEGSSLGDMRIKGLSLLGPLVASFRNVYPFDAATLQPAPLDMEEKVNTLVHIHGLKPKHMAILASPGYIPFIFQKNRAIDSSTEEMARDIHLRLDDDLFFDVAQGRLFQSTPGGLSLQLLSTKYYHELKKPENKALIVTTPHVEKGIIFATDDALIGCQLEPLLQQAGLSVTLLAQKDAHADGVSQALEHSTYFLYTGHGGPESLNTHNRYLTQKDLPPLPPVVAYASACSTTYLRPHLFSGTDGLDWQEVGIKGQDIIGLAMVEKGAVCFVGGATTEDLQYSTSIYSIFMEALLIKGLSVGEALLATQNFISLYSQILQQKIPEVWQNYTYGTANAIHQQVLLGDPALIPCPLKKEASLPSQVREVEGGYSIYVTIPEERWRRAKATVNPGKPTRSYYKSREMEVISPFGTDVVSWGDFYPVAPDADGITDTAVMSSFLHMSLDLPPGKAPLSLHLTEATTWGQECLACGSAKTRAETDMAEETVTSLFNNFRIPFLMLPPSKLDMTKGWPFALETREGLTRVHWLVPLLVIDDRKRMAHRGKKLTFSLQTGPGTTIAGRVKAPGFRKPGSLVVTAGLTVRGEKKTPGVYPLAQTLTREDGSFTLFSAGEAEVLTVNNAYPLYELPSEFKPVAAATWPTDEAEITLKDVEYTRVTGYVIDTITAKPINGAVLRVWRGKYDPSGYPLLEAFAAEATTGHDGSFLLLLTPGDYIFSAAAREGEILYKSSHMAICLEDREEHYITMVMDQAVSIRGRINMQDPPLGFPATVKVRRFPEKEKIKTLALVPTRQDGTFECIVSFQDRFYIVIEEEGRPAVRDTNQGKGYKLKAGEMLAKEYTL
jgi:hypothetical protein